MKKITLSLAAIALSAMSFAALNPFAYGLKSELSADNSKVTVSYSLNADATSVKIVIMDGETAVKTVESDKLVKGVHSLEIPTAGLESNKDYTWKVEVTGAEHETVTNVNTYRAYHPSSIDIDVDPESPYFGRILCIEGNHSVKNTTSEIDYLGKGFGAGIYVFDPSFEKVPNGENPGYNGGNEFTTTHYAVRRVRISQDGRIFLTAQNNGGVFLWEVDPNDLDSWNKVFQGTEKEYTVEDADGNFIAGTNSGFDVRGEGENLQLLMLSASKSGGSIATFRCDEYNLGTATTWNTVPSRENIAGASYMYVTNQSNAQYDKDGGIWYTQYRSNVEDAHPGLVHVTKDGEVDLIEYKTNLCNAGFRFNKDFTKVIVGGKFDAENVGTIKYATIFAVSKDEAGKPVLTKELEIDMTNIGKNLNDFAWDYANNIYTVDNSGEYVAAYALPRTADEVVATPAAKKYVINLSATTFIENVEVINPAQKIIRNGQVLIIRDGKTYNMMGQEIR